MRCSALALCAIAASAAAASEPSIWDQVLKRYTRPRAVAGGGELHLLYQSKKDPQTPVMTCYRRLAPGKDWTPETRLHSDYRTAAHFADALIVFREKSYSVYGEAAWRTVVWGEGWAPAAACRMGQELWVFGAEHKDEQHRLAAARFTRGEGEHAIDGPEAMGQPLATAAEPLDVRALARGGSAALFWLQALPTEPKAEGANELWTASFDGERWGAPARVALPYRNSDYAVAWHGGRVWVFAKERGRRLSAARPLRVVRSTGDGWGAPDVVPGVDDSLNWTYDIAAASFDGSLLLVRARTANL